jgi:hypothetical protein
MEKLREELGKLIQELSEVRDQLPEMQSKWDGVPGFDIPPDHEVDVARTRAEKSTLHHVIRKLVKIVQDSQ